MPRRAVASYHAIFCPPCSCAGVLSAELQNALGMDESSPPPWLINMQRYGPPPSYPSLKIPGLNAPLPPGAQFGYHQGACLPAGPKLLGLHCMWVRLLACQGS